MSAWLEAVDVEMRRRYGVPMPAVGDMTAHWRSRFQVFEHTLTPEAACDELARHFHLQELPPMPIRFTPTDTSASVSFIGADAPR